MRGEMREGKRGDEKYVKSYFDVAGLCCSSEVPLIEKILKPIDGIIHVTVIVPSRTLIITHDQLIISQPQIVKALNRARLEASVRVHGEREYKKKWPSPYAVICGVLVIIASFKYLFPPLKWIALAAVAIGILPISLRAFQSLKNLTLDVNLLVLITVCGTIALHDYLEAASVVFLFTIAEWLQSRASHKATAVMCSLMRIAPRKATVAGTGEEVDVTDVKLNTILSVKSGEMIPIDGIVTHGNCEVDEKTLTGESFPVIKRPNSIVWAGTINLNGYISIQTTAIPENCVVSRMAKLVEEAQAQKSKTQRLIDRIARFYTPAIVLISGGIATIPLAFNACNRDHWLHLALVVLVSACPCALILSTPVATFCALSKSATEGLLIKGGEYLETLAKVKNVAFDKTGTITKGEFSVTNFRSLTDVVSFDTLIYWVSSIESKSSHPLADALVEYSYSHSVQPKPANVLEFRNFPGEGIFGRIDGKDIYIGNKKIAARAGCETEFACSESDAFRGSTIGRIYSDKTCIGFFSLSDSCRSGVADAIKELKSLGIKTSMLTGDSNLAAMDVQYQLGHALDAVHSELLPEDKARIVRAFQKQGCTAMVGDGLNDALALATSDVGISMGISGSALAADTGHMILMSNDMRKVPKAIRLARKTRWKIVENVVFSIMTKVAILSLACAGYPLVWAAVLTDVGTCLLVILNSMTLLRETQNHGFHKHSHCCSNTGSAQEQTHHGHGSTHKHADHCFESGNVHEKKEKCGVSNCSSQICSSIETTMKCDQSKCSSEICDSQCGQTATISNSCGCNERKKCVDKISESEKTGHLIMEQCEADVELGCVFAS